MHHHRFKLLLLIVVICLCCQSNGAVTLSGNTSTDVDIASNSTATENFTNPTLTIASTTTTSSSTTTPTTELFCQDGWADIGFTCFKAFHKLMRWSEARDFCRTLGGDLASIHESFMEYDLNYISVEDSYYWIGLTYSKNDSNVRWSDGTQLDYSSFGTEQPSGVGDEACVVLHRQTWIKEDCDNFRPFFCAIPPGRELLTTPLSTSNPPSLASCPGLPQWVFYAGFCYFAPPVKDLDESTVPRFTWFAARRYCHHNGSELVSIHSMGENDFLQTYVSQNAINNYEYWTGYHQGRRSFYSEWTDQSPLTFMNVDNDNQSDPHGDDCAVFKSVNGKWSEDNCGKKKLYVCKRGVSSTPVIITPTPLIDGGCPPDFVGVENVCYKVVGPEQSLDYVSARNACRSISARHRVDLASITSHVQQVYLMTLLEGMNQIFYIGLNKKELSRGVFDVFWEDNREVKVTYWGTERSDYEYYEYQIPDHDPIMPISFWSTHRIREKGVRRSCTVMDVERKDDMWGSWLMRDDCDQQRGYICMTDKDPSYPKMTPTSSYGCGNNNYVSYNGTCYATYVAPQTWVNAQAKCQQDGGHLVSIRDVHESAKVDLAIFDASVSGPVWIGLSFRKAPENYGWVDDWPLTFTQWDDHEPNFMEPEFCVTTMEGKWNDTRCSNSHPFVCKISTVTPPAGDCKDRSWLSYGSFCYFIPNKFALVSWLEADHLCKKKGMHLLSLHDAEEMNFVIQAFMTSKLKNIYIHSQTFEIWLGLHRIISEGRYTWSDGSQQVVFDNRIYKQPKASSAKKKKMECVVMSIPSGEWKESSCGLDTDFDYNKRYFACKTPKFSSQSGSEGKTVSGGQIAGIIIGLIAVIVVASFGVYIYFVRRQNHGYLVDDEIGFVNAGYDNSKSEISTSPSKPASTNEVLCAQD